MPESVVSCIRVLIQPIDVNYISLIPQKAHDTDAGYDLMSRIDVEILPNTTMVIPTGVRVALPIGYELQIRSRSGLAAKSDIMVLNSPGTVDAGYRGEICVILRNMSMTKSFHVLFGMKIAQAVVNKLPDVELLVMSVNASLPESARGVNGFGSTGI